MIINLLCITLIIFIIAAIIFGFTFLLILREKNNIRSFEVNVTTPLDDEAIKSLDKMIEDAMVDYLVINYGWKQGNFINSEDEKKLISEIAQVIENRISPILLDKLSFYYSADGISEVIANKVYIKVLSYTIDNNKVKNN